MRKVTVEVIVQLTLNADEGIEIDDVINELDYNFSDTTTKADVEDSEILDYRIKDSK